MRMLTNKEMRQRGCAYCKHIKHVRHCPYEMCPYRALDKVQRFEDYCQLLPTSELRKLFKNV